MTAKEKSTRFRSKVMIIDFLVKCVAIDTQSSGRPGLDSLALAKNLQNQLLLDGVDHFVVNVRALFSRLSQAATHKIRAE